MKVLIVEDDENKCLQLKNFILEMLPHCNVTVRRSYNSGLREISHEQHDIVLLDMTMPTYDIGLNEDGGRPKHYAGRSILYQMKRHSIRMPVIVVTQFDFFGEGAEKLTRDELDSKLRADFPDIYYGTVYYNAVVDGWKKNLKSILGQILREDV